MSKTIKKGNLVLKYDPNYVLYQFPERIVTKAEADKMTREEKQALARTLKPDTYYPRGVEID